MRSIALVTALLVGGAAAQDFEADFDAAQRAARSASKDLLLEFTGSDWCVWCKKLRADVLDKEAFRTAIGRDYVLVELDYPRDRSILSPERVARNAELKELYRPGGFPTIVLADAEGVPYATFVGYQQGGPAAFLELVAKARATRDRGRRALAAADGLAGLAKAAKLREFVAALPPGVAERFHPEVVAAIDALEAAASLSLEERAVRYLADRDSGRYRGDLQADRAAFAAVRAGLSAADRAQVRRALLVAELREALEQLAVAPGGRPEDPLVRETGVARALAARAALGEWPGEAAAVCNRVLIGLLAWADARRDPITFEHLADELVALRAGRFAGNEEIEAFLDRRLAALSAGDVDVDFMTAFFDRRRSRNDTPQARPDRDRRLP